MQRLGDLLASSLEVVLAEKMLACWWENQAEVVYLSVRVETLVLVMTDRNQVHNECFC